MGSIMNREPGQVDVRDATHTNPTELSFLSHQPIYTLISYLLFHFGSPTGAVLTRSGRINWEAGVTRAAHRSSRRQRPDAGLGEPRGEGRDVSDAHRCRAPCS